MYENRSARLADANLIEAIREHGRWQQGSECVEEGGVLLLAGSNAAPLAFRNCAARIDPRVKASEAIGQARDFFARHGRGFTVIARSALDGDIEETLRTAGVPEAGAAPCMLLEAPLGEVSLPAGITVERFAGARHVNDAVLLNERAYEMLKLPAEQTRMFFNLPQQLLSSRVIGFVAYRDGRAVSTALTILSGESAGVYWVGTHADAQRGGLGALCTRLATNTGFSNGARVVTLQASPFGLPLYERLGFRTYDLMRRFRHPPPG